ncbi:chromosome segregation protein SMC [Candidatus Pacearchaeota archaeon]|nr:chromosome segregation protein SMC [Candidatus Pacearchaeota archaeon]
MTYIKKIVMHGFKSFARKTEIHLEDAINVIVGPNGSGKSNITDALCFVLGRLSIKSIRAAKAANLIFSGNKTYKGSPEASVELIFDNSDKTFAIDSNEVTIKRIVRKNGQSIYKINNQTKTRQDLLELLAQAGVDPNGFNIVLQGEIQSLVKATPDERRKIIEEVAGISIYETRKHKSLRELEKTEEKLKEVSAVLRERSSYLKNLEKERQEALSYQKLEGTIKKCKATLISRSIKEKEKEIWGIDKIIENYLKEIEKSKNQIYEKGLGLDELQDKIVVINKQIQSLTSNEQEVLHKEISDYKVELAGLTVRKENFESRVINGKEGIKINKQKIEDLQSDIANIKTTSPEIKEQHETQKILQDKFDVLEQQRRKFYMIKSELSTLENRKFEKGKFLIESKKEIQLIEQNITLLSNEIKYAKSVGMIEQLKTESRRKLEDVMGHIVDLEKAVLEKEKRNAILETGIRWDEKLKEDVVKLENCPVCKQTVGEEHKNKISSTANNKIKSAKEEAEKNRKIKLENNEKINLLKQNLSTLRLKLNELDIDEIKLRNADEKKHQIKKITESQEEMQKELVAINEKIHKTKEEFEKLRDIEDRYDDVRLRLQELSLADIDVDTEITVKQRDVNRLSVELKALIRDVEESEVEFKKIVTLILEKEKCAEKKEIEEQKLYEKFQKFFGKRDEFHDQQKVLETDIIGMQHTVRNLEDKVNSNKIQKAQFDAQVDSLKTEFEEFGAVEIISAPIDQIKERLQKAQFGISRIGNVNMRALEVFDRVEEQVNLIREKVETIEGEKEKVHKIIGEIDKKKKKSFIQTLDAVNEYFTRNFSQLSRKGSVFLELENKKDPFEGGLNILIKVSRGKYFDITSLSGGEKTMVALALIFAIQEYKPYCFYVFDEIDAALDKHNSELLAALIKKYMTTGQYTIVTHNDTLISEATNLYGVSMQENISKIISLKI